MFDFINCRKSDVPFIFFMMLWAASNTLSLWSELDEPGPIRLVAHFGASALLGGLSALAIGWLASKVIRSLSAAAWANWVLLVSSAFELTLSLG